jgi:enamine deaminase RidA (YjgF/YER057c/UK114 family)
MQSTFRIPRLLAVLLRRWTFFNAARPLQMVAASAAPFILRHSNPPGLWRSPRLTQMVEVQGARMIYLSGQTPADENYRVHSGDIGEQANAVYDNIEIALKAAGAGWDNVVKTTTYLTDAALIKDFRDARIARFKNLKAAPANTLLIVSRLAEPEFLIEVDVIAAVPAR